MNSHTFDAPRPANSEPGFSHLRDHAMTPASGTLDACDETLESLDVSDGGVSNTEVVTASEPKPPHLALEPFFERTLSNRKAAPNAGTRERDLRGQKLQLDEIMVYYRVTSFVIFIPPNLEQVVLSKTLRGTGRGSESTPN
ncbi:unnamed protein product [Dibothriocephalus latus]|uniref:Uncharacterized protein n=1 Tax=Dibothriocephalus latus TaxID=60516 RepID=A0A3P6U4I7_DIBLA|nr:unnamed protein product [Dibothriocephalus latus]